MLNDNLAWGWKADVEAAAVLDMTLGLNSSLVGSAVATGFPSVVAEFDFLWGFDTTIDPESPEFDDILGNSDLGSHLVCRLSRRQPVCDLRG